MELQRRRARCKPVADKLRSMPREMLSSCNLCGVVEHFVIAWNDRYGLPLRTAMCSNCGLIQMLDRFTPDGYAQFYGDSSYRLLANSYNGLKSDIGFMQREQREYSKQLVRTLEGYVKPLAAGLLMDIGGSTGMIAGRVGKRFGFAPAVLDPSNDEVEAARASGIKGIVGSIETYDNSEQFDLILLCRSIEHLSDLRGSLEKIHSMLRPDGLFYLDAIDYLGSCRRDGAPQVVSKIDHCFWLCQETAPAIFAHMGFEIVATDVSTQPFTLGYVLRRGEPKPLQPIPATWIAEAMRRLRELDSDWRATKNSPNRIEDRLRLNAYRWKKKLGLHKREVDSADEKKGPTAAPNAQPVLERGSLRGNG